MFAHILNWNVKKMCCCWALRCVAATTSATPKPNPTYKYFVAVRVVYGSSRVIWVFLIVETGTKRRFEVCYSTRSTIANNNNNNVQMKRWYRCTNRGIRYTPHVCDSLKSENIAVRSMDDIQRAKEHSCHQPTAGWNALRICMELSAVSRSTARLRELCATYTARQYHKRRSGWNEHATIPCLLRIIKCDVKHKRHAHPTDHIYPCVQWIVFISMELFTLMLHTCIFFQPMRFIYFVVKLLHILESEKSVMSSVCRSPFFFAIHNLSVLLYSFSSFSMICFFGCIHRALKRRKSFRNSFDVIFFNDEKKHICSKLKSESWFDFKCYRSYLQKVFDWFDDVWNVFVRCCKVYRAPF